jgi:hypothetical protein
MGRLIFLLFVVSAAMKAVGGKWPWEMLALPRRDAPSERARTLLGVGQAATRAEILDAHRRLIARVHPDRGGTSSLVFEANDARDLLLSRLGTGNQG